MARGRFQPAEFERKWQEWWDKQGIYYARDDDPREKYYNLVMFPYPSGDLHIGHWYNYTGADIYGRFMRMRGYNVSQPIGFDAFGLPAENAAIKRNIQPRSWTLDNIGKMRAQTAPDGRGLGLAARGRHLPARVLPLDAVALPAVLQARAGLPDQGARQLVPELQHDAGQRAGRQRRLRALRHAGRAARDRPVAASASPSTPTSCCDFDGLDWPEKTRLMQTQLDRAQRGRRDPLHARSCRGRHGEGDASRFPSSPRGPTRSTA